MSAGAFRMISVTGAASSMGLGIGIVFVRGEGGEGGCVPGRGEADGDFAGAITAVAASNAPPERGGLEGGRNR